MEYRRLPGTDIDLSVLCFGPLRFTKGIGGVDGGRRALKEAIDRGVNVIHSSPRYGSHGVLVEALASYPDRANLHHIVKVPTPDYGEKRFDPRSFRRQVDAALSSFGVERIAVVQHLHRGPASEAHVYDERGDSLRIPFIDAVLEPLFEETDALKRQGKIASLSCFPHSLAYAERVIDAGFDGIVHFFGPLEPELATMLGAVAERDMALIGIRPLLQGLITDRGVDRSSLPEGDVLLERRWDAWYDRLNSLRGRWGDDPLSWTEFAIRFSITPPQVVTSVIGLDTVEQVELAVAAVERGGLTDGTVEVALDVFNEQGPIPKSTLSQARPWTMRRVLGMAKRRIEMTLRSVGQ